jgi:hypothetical protein
LLELDDEGAIRTVPFPLLRRGKGTILPQRVAMTDVKDRVIFELVSLGNRGLTGR